MTGNPLKMLSPRRGGATFTLHLAMAVIIAGALLTHFTGIEGKLHLQTGAEPATHLEDRKGPGDGTLPFGVSLVESVTEYYPGTSTPMDFASLLRITSSSGETLAEKRTAMNKVMEYEGWRFFQSAISAGSSTLVVSYDPAGTAVTYAGYLLAALSMIMFFFQRHTLWKGYVRRLSAMAAAFLLCLPVHGAAPATIQKPLAANLGKVHVLWNGRVCPLQTMARDVTVRLYGKDTHLGYTAEQVLAGWLFYYDGWMADLEASGAGEEQLNLGRWIGSGAAFRIYPYLTANGVTEWLSLSERRPSKMGLEQWLFIQQSMPQICALAKRGRNVAADRKISELIEGQRRYAPPGTLPSELSMRMERMYNRYARVTPAALILLAAGLAGMYAAVTAGDTRKRKYVNHVTGCLAVGGVIYLGWNLAVRSYVGGHLPFANGPETMLSLSVAALIGALCAGKEPVLRPALLVVGGLAALVAAMGEKTPQIEHLMPVLASPWLSIHVMLVILSYAAAALMAVLGATGLLCRNAEARCAALNRVILLPMVFLLGAGIMAGAVWANQSWGRYWGWDPKETCALMTLLVYSLPLHPAIFRGFMRDRIINAYALAASGAVLFTYFGANYLLPGLHSYA